MIAKDDPIFYWNDVALEANRHAHTAPGEPQTGPTMSSRALAIVHLAMHDAYFGVLGGALYLQGNVPAAPATPNAQAAIAAAAATTLSALYPARRATFEAAMNRANIPATDAYDSARYGREIGALIIERLGVRDHEPGAGDKGHVGSPAHGAHRVDPDNPTQGYHGPYYGTTAQPIAITARHALASPPALISQSYRDALREVIDVGGAPGLSSTKRSAEQTLIGLYWAYDGAKNLGTPPRLYNLIVRRILQTHPRAFTTGDTARVFALVNAAMGDAGLLAWREKYKHDLWRPVLGVREHQRSMGPTGSPGSGGDPLCDPFWLPLGAPRTNTPEKPFTPPFPAYPSGHATFGAAAFQMLRLFLRHGPGGAIDDPQFVDDVAFDFVSEELNGESVDHHGTVRARHRRSFGSLWEAIFENAVSRVYLGVHWVFDSFAADDVKLPDGTYKSPKDIRYTLTPNGTVGGVGLGLAIANDIFTSGLKESELSPGMGPQPGVTGGLPRLNLEATNIR